MIHLETGQNWTEIKNYEGDRKFFIFYFDIKSFCKLYIVLECNAPLPRKPSTRRHRVV